MAPPREVSTRPAPARTYLRFGDRGGSLFSRRAGLVGKTFISQHREDDHDGIRGYLLKEADRRSIARALEAAASGDALLGGAVAERVLARAGTAAVPQTPDPNAFPDLTDREREILELVARGLTNGAIADRLALSEKTVRNHVSNVFSKLYVRDRAEAVARARDAGDGKRGA